MCVIGMNTSKYCQDVRTRFVRYELQCAIDPKMYATVHVL